MRALYLIRHASPQVHPDQPARAWQLSGRGRREAETIAGQATSWGLRAVYSSTESKARATALIVAAPLGLDVRVAEGFDELRMPDWIANADEFNDTVRRVLEEPSDGSSAESAAGAAARFEGGLAIVEEGPFPAAVVSHGRIITAWLTRCGAIEDPYQFWRAIPMPGWLQVDLDQPPAAWNPAFRA